MWRGALWVDANRKTVFLTEVNRFVGPLKAVCEAGAKELRFGSTVEQPWNVHTLLQ